MKPLLSVEELQVAFKTRYGLLSAVRGISFSIKEGEMVGIVGESGSGKSAAAKALLRLLPPQQSATSGSIWYRDLCLTSLSEKAFRSLMGKELAMIFQDPMSSLNPTLKVGYQIAEGLLRHRPDRSVKEAYRETIQMMRRVGIAQPEVRAEEYPHTLSGGMRQRIAIALALIAKPSLVIADEPTTSLDSTVQAQILYLLKEIQSMGTAILLISHDWRLIAQFCDRVLVMYGGSIVESAPTAELLEKPRHPYTRSLIAAIPRMDSPKDRPLPAIEGAPPSPLSPLPGCAFEPRCPYREKRCRERSPDLIQVASHVQVACFKDEERSHELS